MPVAVYVPNICSYTVASAIHYTVVTGLVFMQRFIFLHSTVMPILHLADLHKFLNSNCNCFLFLRTQIISCIINIFRIKYFKALFDAVVFWFFLNIRTLLKNKTPVFFVTDKAVDQVSMNKHFLCERNRYKMYQLDHWTRIKFV